MENIIFEGSPLAEYLEGEGNAEPGYTAPHHDASEETSPMTQNFAPKGPSTLQSKIKGKLPQPLRILPHSGPVAKLHDACSRAVNSRLGRADNQRFLEHFRYQIVASQLLSQDTGLRSSIFSPPGLDQSPRDYKTISISLNGAAVTGIAAFALVWLLHWTRNSTTGYIHKGKAVLVFSVFVALSLVFYGYIRRQWLQYLRQEAVDAASGMITNLQALNASTSSALTLVQEVELVSRGYRLSSPLPPVTKIEEQSQGRRCMRLRRSLHNVFIATLPVFTEQYSALRQLVDEDGLEKYFDVYDINNPDIQEAVTGYKESEFEESDSLKPLRIWQYRLITLRRVILCSLLALEATGGESDFYRWRAAVNAMDAVASISGDWSEKINNILGEEEQFKIPSPAKAPSNPGKARLRAQIRNLSSLSQGIRGLQAKMQILREESNKSLEESEDLTELGASLMSQYESIGADLRSLMQAWDSGKTALALSINRHERRISQSSSTLRSPVPSLSGLTVVEEGSPADALRALNGELSPRSSVPSVAGSNSDEEIFEAMAIPRQRNVLSREERMAKIQEDRARQAYLKEQRDTNTNMLRELESVINLRPRRLGGARITSI